MQFGVTITVWTDGNHVNLPDQPHRHGQLAQTREPMLHSLDVVDRFVHVTRKVDWIEQLCFGGQQSLERALRSLDLARQDGLLSDVHAHQHVGMQQGPAQPDELASVVAMSLAGSYME